MEIAARLRAGDDPQGDEEGPERDAPRLRLTPDGFAKAAQGPKPALMQQGGGPGKSRGAQRRKQNCCPNARHLLQPSDNPTI